MAAEHNEVPLNAIRVFVTIAREERNTCREHIGNDTEFSQPLFGCVTGLFWDGSCSTPGPAERTDGIRKAVCERRGRTA